VLSLGALYLFAVLPIAVLFGFPYAIATSVGSLLVFNFLFLPPLHTFALREPENWVALAVYLVTALVVSELAARERRRARQAVEAEALRRSDAVKTTILRAVSHDLRSPLTAIRAAAEGLSSGSITLGPEERDEQLETIRAEARRLERLVANLLDLSRLEAGAARPARELWTVDTLVSWALDEVGPDAARVRVDIPDGLPPISVDAAQIERAVANLLENALRVTPLAESVEVTATEEGGAVVLRVADHGPGIPPGEVERLLQPFERGLSAGGAGLGLAIARGFASANGARLWVESRSGGGTTCALALPVGERARSIR